MNRCLLLVALVAACGKSHDDAVEGSAGPLESSAPCTQLPFAASTLLAEASGAAWLIVDGARVLVVVSDSGNAGAYAIVDPETGQTIEHGKLPLGEAGDDIEGASTRNGQLVGLTSSGWIREWERVDHGFSLVRPAYPIGPIDLPDQAAKMKPPTGDGMVCGAKATNCGRDYEGLCLAAKPATSCVGMVASRADGHVYCLEDREGKLAVDRAQAIAIGRSGTLADCSFSEDDRLFVGANVLGGNQVVRVDGWATPATAKVVPVGPLGVGFPEVIAARGDVIWRMSDTGGAPSLMTKYRCGHPGDPR